MPVQLRRSHLNAFIFILTPTESELILELNEFNTNDSERSAMYILICYFTYLAGSLATTIWVAQTLRRNGRTFLIDAFHGNRDLADSVNHLLVVGFYLINIGYVTLALHTPAEVTTARAAVEMVCDKFGLVLIVLGGMHFLNLYVFNRLRRRGQADLRPPFPPDEQIAFQPES